ncbi:MAG: hypothetical protein U1B80_01460 [Anaerolineaceae bacterium]|nr:hypothetical protein [Anaerolineaceae bacterium]
MFNPDTEILFPMRVIPSLASTRGEPWHRLVSQVTTDGEEQARLGFVLMMVRIAGCVTCNADSFRAMRGCTQCALQSVRRFRGSDDELVQLFKEACQEVSNHSQKRDE